MNYISTKKSFFLFQWLIYLVCQSSWWKITQQKWNLQSKLKKKNQFKELDTCGFLYDLFLLWLFFYQFRPFLSNSLVSNHLYDLIALNSSIHCDFTLSATYLVTRSFKNYHWIFFESPLISTTFIRIYIVMRIMWNRNWKKNNHRHWIIIVYEPNVAYFWRKKNEQNENEEKEKERLITNWIE